MEEKDPLYILINALEIKFEAQLNTGKPWSTFQQCLITQLGQYTSILQYFIYIYFLKVVKYLAWYKKNPTGC